MSRRAFYITTAIDYVNAEPHMGHAYEKVGADAAARFQRLRGRDVRFTLGTDEHGQKVAEAAEALGVEPQAHVDRVSGRFREVWRQLDVESDDFIRTTEPRHRRAVTELFRRIQAAGDLYPGDYIGWYCKFEETFWTESKLEAGNCPTCQRPVQKIAEKNYFFRLSKFTKPLLEHFAANPEFILPVARRQEMVNILEEGLEDLSISRASVRWGIPFPDDPGHVIYVWFDALINYITSAGFPDEPARFETYWPADCHVIGKDIAKFHTLIWPAMLLSAGLPLPRHVFVHGFVLTPTGKMSKSVGNVIAPGELAERYGADALRYTLLREIAWGQDGVVSEEILVNRYNRDLANDLGNLLSRVSTLIEKSFGGEIPAADEAHAGPIEAELREAAKRAEAAAAEGYEAMLFHQALEGAWILVRAANQYVDRCEPWKWAAGKRGDGDRTSGPPGADEARARLGTILSLTADALLQSATMLFPVIPGTSRRLRSALGAEGDPKWEPEAPLTGSLRGRHIRKGPSLFPRIETAAAKVAAGAGSAAASSTAPAEGPAKPDRADASAVASACQPAAAGVITYDDFARTELRVARILSARRVEKADKLLQLEVSLGAGGTRTVVAGVAQSYEPETLVGRRVILVANLKPAKIRGVESHGMLLAATGADGRHRLVQPDADIEDGARVK